ncbi:YciI family protein [Nocardioides gansuensis]|uniref:YciI family protein n=1 Tax=Nocardioides gansuensis TaxID=2138300 RepID=UPI003CCC101C
MDRLRGLANDGLVLVAGPDVSDEGAVLVLLVPDVDAATAVMDADVYLQSGAVTSYTADAFVAVVTSPALSG